MKGNPKSKRVLLTEKQKQIMRENASPDMTIAELRRLADVNTINTAHSFVARENLPHKIVGRGRSDPYEQERRKTEIMKLADQGYEARDIEVMIGRTYEIIVRTVRVVTGMSFGVYRKTCVLPFLETSREPEPERTPCMLLVEKWPLCRDHRCRHAAHCCSFQAALRQNKASLIIMPDTHASGGATKSYQIAI